MEYHQHTYILDRIEGTVAVLLDPADDTILEIPFADLPCGSHEGCVLHLCGGLWSLDPEAEENRRRAMQNRLEMLLKKK